MPRVLGCVHAISSAVRFRREWQLKINPPAQAHDDRLLDQSNVLEGFRENLGQCG